MPRGHYSSHKNPKSLSEQAILSRNPEKAIQEMMDTIDDLRGVYIAETAALQNADTKGFLDIQERKLLSAQKYQKSIEEIMARKQEMRGIDISLKQRLERMQQEFSEITRENMDALSRMQRTMERLGNTVRTAAKEAVNRDRSYSYGEQGTLKSNEHKVVSTGLSETA